MERLEEENNDGDSTEGGSGSDNAVLTIPTTENPQAFFSGTSLSFLLSSSLKLRHYQWQGIQWLISIHDNDINGILADEVVLSLFFIFFSLFNFFPPDGTWKNGSNYWVASILGCCSWILGTSFNRRPI
jgi:hypothetical protein